MLLVQIVPFQLLIIPIYVMIVRTYGLADTYLGMIVPFAINSAAVFIFRQFFMALPEDLFAAARLDGASEVRILWSIALPLARLHFRGQGSLFAVMLLVQIVPFQLLIIPIYVMIVRTYGLADTYMGMIVPFAINSAAVFIFRQFFMALPEDLFAAARLDGASEVRILWSIALPLARPALLTATLLTFIGPWNEFLWPFLVTKDATMQPLAVSLANFISSQAGRSANPFGSILAGAVVLAIPAVALFVAFQKHFTASDLGSGVKG
jgi:multiple sugar transport system permease protein